MPQHEQHEATNGRFEEELGAALRSTGAAFEADDHRELVTGGLTRGRRRLLRRRLAVAGGTLALAAIGVGGVYGGSVLGRGEAVEKSSVAAPRPTGKGGGEVKPGGEAEIPVADLVTVLKGNTPAGDWEIQDPEGKGQSVTAVYDDGKGKAGVSVGLYRASFSPESGEGQVTCPDPVAVPFDDCKTERLADGSRLMVVQGYEYPDRRVDTKSWRAVLLTRDGFLVDASEWNAATQKDAPISRPDPPFDPAQLKTLVTAAGWRPLLERLPAIQPDNPGAGGGARHEPSAAEIQSTLVSLMPKGVRTVSKGGDSGYGYVVVDDGKGRSLVQINVQPFMDVRKELFSGGDVTVEPDDTRVRLTKEPGEKGGEGVVMWTADTLGPDDFRVVISAFNAGTQHEAATRAEPALTTEQLKAIALSPKWRALTRK
ncbi:hypothetical protein ACIGEZ_08330 [Streptomyces sp. NPDC085481]|uniref:hypothetical protein n=1 Tax=Streptomyces sp. NPDC085481 TaxID=3365727 RepID=UPI0037D948ED